MASSEVAGAFGLVQGAEIMSANDLPCSESDLRCAIACDRVLLSGGTPEARLSVAKHVHAATGGAQAQFVLFKASQLCNTQEAVTLFITELGELHSSEQTQLLECLSRWMTHGVRVISATGYDALDLLRSHRLDATLLYRLNIVHIKLRGRRKPLR